MNYIIVSLFQDNILITIHFYNSFITLLSRFRYTIGPPYSSQNIQILDNKKKLHIENKAFKLPKFPKCHLLWTVLVQTGSKMFSITNCLNKDIGGASSHGKHERTRIF